MSTIDILERAKGILEQEGWTQGCYCDKRGFCASGAIGAGAGLVVTPFTMVWPSSENTWHTYMKAAKSFVEAVGLGEFGIPGWNDYQGRTKEEVIEAFNAAIASEAARELDMERISEEVLV